MKDVVGLTSIVQAKQGRFYKTTFTLFSISIFAQLILSPLSLSLYLLSSFDCHMSLSSSSQTANKFLLQKPSM